MSRPSLLLVLASSLLLGACSTHQLRFKPLIGIPADEAAELQRGELRASSDQVFDAAATTLEHEPFLHWSVSSLDKANGFIKADAGLLREVQLRVTTVIDAQGASVAGRTRLEVSIPRRPLKTRAKIWTKDKTGFRTAYEPAQAELPDYSVIAVDAELDADYLRSFAWRVLHDHSQVPFSLSNYDDGEPVRIQTAPAFGIEDKAAPAPASPKLK